MHPSYGPSVQRFARESCVLTPTGTVDTVVLYLVYDAWAHAQRQHRAPRATFNAWIKALGVTVARHGPRATFVGLALREGAPDA